MDTPIDFIAFIFGAAGLLALIGVVTLVMVDEHIAQRRRAAHKAARCAGVKQANAELDARPRLRFPSPLPTMKGTSTQ